ERQQRGCGVGTAAAQPAAQRQALVEADFGAARAARVRLQQAGGAHDEVVGDADPAAVAAQHDIRAVRGGKFQDIAVIEQLKQRLQQVVAVAAPSDDVQEEVEFGGGKQAERDVHSTRHSPMRKVSR